MSKTSRLRKWRRVPRRCSAGPARLKGRGLRTAVLAGGLQVDAELLAFFIEMASLQAESFGGLGHMVAVSLQLGQQELALERFDALGQASRRRYCRGPVERSGRQRSLDRSPIYMA